MFFCVIGLATTQKQMKGQLSFSDIAQLLAGYAGDSLTEEELRQLMWWKNESEENTRLFEKVTQQAFTEKKIKQLAQVDYAAGWLAIRARAVRRRKTRYILRVASVAAGILLPVLLILFLRTGHESEVEARIPLAIYPGESKAELIWPDGTRQWLGKSELPLSLKDLPSERAVWDEMIPENEADIPMSTVYVPRGAEFSVLLSDGTTVILNSESRISFPITFGTTERTIHFSGEAWFEVARDTTRPFVIQTATTSITVLGTSFNVRAYEEEAVMETTLEKGSVLLSAGGREMILAPGEQGVTDKSLNISKQKVDVSLYTAWKNDSFVFVGQRLEEVMARISRWYDIEVVFKDPALKDILFSGKVKRYEEFSRIIEMLEMTGDTKFEIYGKKVLISQ